MIKVSMEWIIMGSSEAKAWPIILVSEHQKGHKSCLSAGGAGKATPARRKGAALSLCQSRQSMATFCQEYIRSAKQDDNYWASNIILPCPCS
jgi:hypothetical protein